MRKFIISGVVAAMMLGTTTFAQTSISSNVNNGTAEVKVVSDNAGGIYTLYILKPGKTAADIKDGTDAFAGVEQLSLTFEEGSDFADGTLSFKLPSYGAYTAILGGGELSGKELKLVYAENTSAAVSAVKGATVATVESVLTGENNGAAWFVDTENDAYKENKSAVLKSFIEIVDDAQSGADVTEAFNKACAIAEVKTCTEAELYDELFMAEAILGISLGEEAYKQTPAMSAAFVSLRKTEELDTPAELLDVLKKAEALAKLNEATRDTVIDIIEDYNSVFKLDLDGDYRKVDKYALAKKLVVTGGNTYDSIAEVKERFEEAVEAVLDKESGSGTSSTGGGGGGGGGSRVGGSYPTKNPEVVSDDLMNNNTKTDEFADLDGAEWAKPYILYLAENNIMNGDGNGSFRPNDKVLREEFLKTLIEALKLADTEAEATAFEDVDNDAWYAKYIAAGVKLGIVNGKEESLFGIGDEITRQDAAVMVKRAVEAAGYTLYAEGEEGAFTDADAISDYAKEAVEALRRAGVINGYETGEFAPQNSILRSETAKIVYTMLSGINK